MSSIDLRLPIVVNPPAMIKKRAILYGVYALGFLLGSPGWAGDVPQQTKIDASMRTIAQAPSDLKLKFQAILGVFFGLRIDDMDQESARYAKYELNRVLRENFPPLYFETNQKEDWASFATTLQLTVTSDNREESIEYFVHYLSSENIPLTFGAIDSLLNIVGRLENYIPANSQLFNLIDGKLSENISILTSNLEGCDEEDRAQISARLEDHLSYREYLGRIRWAKSDRHLPVVQIPKKAEIDAAMKAICATPSFSDTRFEAISAAVSRVAAMDPNSARYAKTELNAELRRSFSPDTMGGGFQEVVLVRVERLLAMLESTVTPDNLKENIEHLSAAMLTKDGLFPLISVYVIRTILRILQHSGYQSQYEPRLFLMSVLLEASEISHQSLVTEAFEPSDSVKLKAELRFIRETVALVQNELPLEFAPDPLGSSGFERPADELQWDALGRKARELVLAAARLRLSRGRPLSLSKIDQFCSVALLARREPE